MRALVCAALLAPVLCAQSSPGVDFSRDVAPIFSRCQGCHGSAMQTAGVRFDDPAAILKGGASGPIVKPGTSAESKLIQRVSSTKPGFRMPPAGESLTAAQIATLRAWIDQGAKIPAVAATAHPAPARAAHWSFLSYKPPPVPDVRDRAWPRNAIDNFILARLEHEQIEPSPEANRRTLVRRLSLDLIGLPPTPAEVDAFVNDNRPNAYERLVDRLLASPHYGEKWAREWLDLAHYADSDGYEKDLVRPWAWRYRNWVINALNADMPYDEFVIEQLAGDELPHATTAQRVATGFLRNTLTNREAGVDRMEARFDQIVNNTNTIGTVFMGLTVGCSQCHNHKFDPITQKDYYSLSAFVNTAEEQTIEAPLPGERGPWLAAKPVYDQKRQAVLEKYGIAGLQADYEAKLKQAFATPGKDLEWDFAVTEFRAGFDGAERYLHGYWTNASPFDRDRLTDFFLARRDPDVEKDKDAKTRVEAAHKEINALEKALPRYSMASVVQDDPIPRKAYIHTGGDYQALGAEVHPDTPAFLPGMPPGEPHNRLSLARWLVSRDNPLTARVEVNRLWQELFGRGLVRTSEDFGTQGDAPSHPELLNWLACEFVDHGWSMKYIQKEIVMSAAYQQSSDTRKDIAARDPENELVARQSRVRLPAELIRDEALAVSGLLNTAIGGPSVRPPQPAGVAELGYANSVKWVESAGPDKYRRGLYIHFQRTTPYPMLMNFDAPDSNTSCTRRRRSNTSLQALNLLNDPVFFEAAQALATRVLQDGPENETARIRDAFELCLGRNPNPREEQRLERYFDAQKSLLTKETGSANKMEPFTTPGVANDDAAAWVGLSRVLLNLDEFITRE